MISKILLTIATTAVVLTTTKVQAADWIFTNNNSVRTSREFNQNFALPKDDYDKLVWDYEAMCEQMGYSTTWPRQKRIAYKFEHTPLGKDSKGWHRARVTCDIMYIPVLPN